MLNRRSLVAALAGAAGAPLVAAAEGSQLPADMIQMSQKKFEDAMRLAYLTGRLSVSHREFVEQALRGELESRKASGVEVQL